MLFLTLVQPFGKKTLTHTSVVTILIPSNIISKKYILKELKNSSNSFLISFQFLTISFLIFLYIFNFEQHVSPLLRDHNVNTSFIGMYCVILPTAKVILIFSIFQLALLATFLFIFISVTQL